MKQLTKKQKTGDNILRLKYRRVKHILRVWVLRLKNPKATHSFFFSEDQNGIGREYPNQWRTHHNYFKGVEYSEMKGFEFGYFSNWDDAVFLGIGNDQDIEIKGSILI